MADSSLALWQSSSIYLIYSRIDEASLNGLLAHQTTRLMCMYSMDVRSTLVVNVRSKAVVVPASLSLGSGGVKMLSLTRLLKYWYGMHGTLRERHGSM